jgi:hypothetical protein
MFKLKATLIVIIILAIINPKLLRRGNHILDKIKKASILNTNSIKNLNNNKNNLFHKFFNANNLNFKTKEKGSNLYELINKDKKKMFINYILYKSFSYNNNIFNEEFEDDEKEVPQNEEELLECKRIEDCVILKKKLNNSYHIQKIKDEYDKIKKQR